MSDSRIPRRSFVRGLAVAGAGAMLVPRHVLGGQGFTPPSDTLNVAIVGVGGMGLSNAEQLDGQNIVALCDVDFGYVDRQVASRLKKGDGSPRPEGERLQASFARAQRYTDFRRMLERQRDIDAVLIATPDHLHAHVALAAMDLGKHVYVQKPLAATVHETRLLQAAAARTGVVTQMGNQGHSADDARRINEWIAAGVIGPVSKVLIWTNRPIWPQGVPRPATYGQAAERRGWGMGALNTLLSGAMSGDYPVPEGMDWDLYLGPAQERAFHPLYHPFNWRGWVDFGVGALGDMGAHLVDHPFWALDLGYPTSVEATSTPFGGGSENPATWPQAMTAHYEFPARGGRPPVSLDWYDGGLMPPRPELMPDDVKLEREGGVLYIGERGILMHETYGRNPQIFPEHLRQEAVAVSPSIPRVSGSHEMNWVNACKGEGSAVSPFSYAAPLTEVMLLGLVALRSGQGRKIRYDSAGMRLTNAPDADHFLTREYRAGWEL